MTLNDCWIKGILVVFSLTGFSASQQLLPIYWITLTAFLHVNLRRKKSKKLHHAALKTKRTNRRIRFWGKHNEFHPALNWLLIFLIILIIIIFRFMSKRRLLIISAPTVDDYSFHQQLQALNGQECPMGRHRVFWALSIVDISLKMIDSLCIWQSFKLNPDGQVSVILPCWRLWVLDRQLQEQWSFFH